MKITKHHRLLIYNDLTFREEASIRLTMTNIVLFGVSCLVIVGGFIFLMVRIFSQHAPDSPEVAQAELRGKLIQIYAQLDSLENEVAAKEVYITQIKKILNKDFDTEAKLAAEAAKNPSANSSPSQTVIPAKTDAVVAMQENAKNGGNSTPSPAVVAVPVSTSAGAQFSNGFELQNVGYVAPLRGIMKDSFSPDRNHYGVDIVAPKGSVIKSVQNGTVILATWSLDNGYCIGVLHPDNSIAFYKNNSSLLKKEGDRVKSNEAIAIIGEAGEGANPVHLHFELWKQGLPVRPQAYIQF
jgi:murein DD-endopeptidase MepM/ murein hydrolase activator NlpD